jgi:hypothetical protein
MRILTLTESDNKFIKSMLKTNCFNYLENSKEIEQKTLCAKIYLKFYTGKIEKNGSFFIYFGKKDPQIIREMSEILESVSKNHKKIISK